MSDERYCPRCGIEWPNFCPRDGQKLSGPWSCSNAQKPHATASGTAADSVSGAPRPKRDTKPGGPSRTARTILEQPSVKAEDIARRARADAGPKPAPAAKTHQAPTAKTHQAPTAKTHQAGKKREFSETQWFMKGIDPSLMVDPETGAVQVDEEEYLRDDSIPEEERRKFTLRRRGEE